MLRQRSRNLLKPLAGREVTHRQSNSGSHCRVGDLTPVGNRQDESGPTRPDRTIGAIILLSLERISSRSSELALHDSLRIGVFRQPFQRILNAHARLFVATKGDVRTEHVHLVDPNRARLDPFGYASR